MMSFAYDIIDPCDLIGIPAEYGSIRDSNTKNVPPSIPILYMCGMAGAGGMCGRGMCMAEVGMCGRGHAWQRGMHGRGLCMAGGRRDGHYSGRYASYWNAFLFQFSFYSKSSIKLLY